MEDRRVQKTKKAIEDAFETLIQNVDYEKITVSAIAKEANINRKTFYLHYPSVEDLLNSLAERHARGAMQKISNQGLLDADPIDIDAIVQEIGEIYRVTRIFNPLFMNKLPIKSLVKAMRGTWIELVQSTRAKRNLPSLENAEYYVDYLLGGMLFAYEQWFNTPSDVQFDEIAKVVVTAMLYGAEGIFSK